MISFWDEPFTIGNAIVMLSGWTLGRVMYVYFEYRQHKKDYKQWVTLLTPEQIKEMSRD